MAQQLASLVPTAAVLQAAARKMHLHTACLGDVSAETALCHELAVSQLFDAAYYLAQYPDVARSEADPVLHFVRYGAAEKRNPAPWFDTALYLKENADVDPAQINPFYHYILHGHAEGRRANKDQKKAANRLIVSLTSFPLRIATLPGVLVTLLNQTEQPDMVILWLAADEFPGKEQSLPPELLDLRQHGLTIRWCPNYRSYKKLIPALREFADDIIVTADDDVYYEADWLEKLYASYTAMPAAIHCHRAHRIQCNAQGIKPYRDWKLCVNRSDVSYLNFFTTGGGVLFPPHSLYKDVLNDKLFMRLAPYGDDIWFWAMAVMQGTPCVVVDECHNQIKSVHIEGDKKLWTENLRGRNDSMLHACVDCYPELLDRLQEAAQAETRGGALAMAGVRTR